MTVSWERSWLSNTHFMWPWVPEKHKIWFYWLVQYHSNKFTAYASGGDSYIVFFYNFSPKASLMWPLRPHFDRSSTGLNHIISSVTERNKEQVECELKTICWGKFKVLFCGRVRNKCSFPLTPVKEHVTDNGWAPVYLERVSAQDDPLQHNTLRVTAEQAAGGHQVLDV